MRRLSPFQLRAIFAKMKSGVDASEKAAKRKKIGDTVIRAGQITEGSLAIAVPIKYAYRLIKAHKAAVAATGAAGATGYKIGTRDKKKKKSSRQRTKREAGFK